jgi:pimeloyl-ACP methyl ester carboxylesterase
MYRSGDFAKLAPYEGKLGALGVPTLILWGEKDEFAPVGGGYRFQKQIPHAHMVVLAEAGHYLMEDDPDRVGEEVRSFLTDCRKEG